MPLEIFYSYAHEDERLRDELEKHLLWLQHLKLAVTWHDRQIDPGGEWEKQIDQHINSARIILLLISPDFINSSYCYEREMQIAMERHSRGEAIVIPIILRPVMWQVAPFGKLQALPTDGKPVATRRNKDQAFAEIADSIRKIVQELYLEVPPSPPPGSRIVEAHGPAERVLDAAMPGHIVKDEPTILLILVRLPDSEGA